MKDYVVALNKYVNLLVHDYIEKVGEMDNAERNLAYGRINGVLEAITVCVKEDLKNE